LTVFKKFYPELMDKNSVKYPIEDKLVLKMPELHGNPLMREAPQFKKVLLEP